MSRVTAWVFQRFCAVRYAVPNLAVLSHSRLIREGERDFGDMGDRAEPSVVTNEGRQVGADTATVGDRGGGVAASSSR
jgi:hypothetical protein